MISFADFAFLLEKRDTDFGNLDGWISAVETTWPEAKIEKKSPDLWIGVMNGRVVAEWNLPKKQGWISLEEASYAGNLGISELFKFYDVASAEQKNHLQDLLNSKKFKDAWQFLQDVVGVKLHSPS